MSRAVLAAALVVLGLGAVACTSAGSGSPTGVVSSPTAPGVTSSAPPTTAPASSTAPASTAAPSTPAAATTTAPASSTTPSPTGPPPCTGDQLSITSVVGGAFQGREIAGVVFTNRSTATCSLTGYPFAQLRYQGNDLGQPATHNPGTARVITLKPGGAAQAQLTAVSTCQAPVSDHARIRIPGATTDVVVPMQLRGCALSVDPIEAG